MFLSLPKFWLGFEAITSSAQKKRKWSTDYSKPPGPPRFWTHHHSPAPGVSFVKLLTQNSKSWKQKQTRVCESRKQWVTEGSPANPFAHILLSFSRSYLSQCDPTNLLYIRLIYLDLSILYIVDYEDLVFKQNRLILLLLFFWNNFS